MNQLEFDFNKPKKSKEPDYKALAQYLMSRRKIPEWYTDSAIRLNYKVMSETAARAGIQFPTFKEYERQVKAGERTLGISVGRGY
jgi:hypothetical protein